MWREDVTMRPARERTSEPNEPGGLSLWAGLLVPPLAVLVAQTMAYAFVPEVGYRDRPPLILHLTEAFWLLVIVACGLLARRNWATAGREWPADSGGRVQRSRFLAAMGAVGAVFFALVLLGMWLAVAFISPTQ